LSRKIIGNANNFRATYTELLKIAAKDYAPGLPEKGRYSRIPKVEGSTWQMSVQKHVADVAGTHRDLRLSDPRTGIAHSWAIPKDLPAAGEKVLAVRQPAHRASYANWSGKIQSGYGKGDVSLQEHKKVDVLSSGPNKITFVVPEGRVAREMTLIRTGGRNWLLLNHSTTEGKYGISYHKPAYGQTPFGNVDTQNREKLLSAKISGAHAVGILERGKRPRLFSYRKSKRGTPLEYTWKMPRKFNLTRWAGPSMRVRGEIYAVDKTGKALPENEIGRVLNSSVENARAVTSSLGARLLFAPFQVETLRGRPFKEGYEEHLPILKKIVSSLPATKLPAMARTPAQKRRLLVDISSGKLKQTSEGVVEWDLKNPDAPPVKAKIRPDFDVFVRGVFNEGGARKGMAGGFLYSLTPQGKVVGRVGSGLSHKLKAEMLKDPNRFRGLSAKVKANYQFASGALRAPSFVGWHWEKSYPKKSLP